MTDLRIFLSYNLGRSDTVVVWRLQTLAAAHGITLYVPHPQDRRSKAISARIAQMIDAANLTVVLCAQQFSQRVGQEVDYAIQRGKPVLLILEESVELPSSLQGFPAIRFDLRRDPPGELENRIISHLRQYQQRYRLRRKQADTLGLLLGIGAALLGLWLLTKE